MDLGKVRKACMYSFVDGVLRFTQNDFNEQENIEIKKVIKKENMKAGFVIITDVQIVVFCVVTGVIMELTYESKEASEQIDNILNELKIKTINN